LNFLEALFTGAKAMVKHIVGAVRSVVRGVLNEVGPPAQDRPAALGHSAADRFFQQAQQLADQERELAEKAQRDRKKTEADVQRLRQLAIERERVRAEMERANAQAAAQQLRERAGDTLLAKLDDDELSSNVGILAAKACPACAGMMRIRQGALAAETGQRRFYWQCTEPHHPPCPTIKLDPSKHDAGVLRLADPDLDTPKPQRHAEWNRPDVLAQTHGRLRQHLGDDDKQVVCPQHLLPMKLLPKRAPGGRVLDSYEYVCLGVTAEGKACEHKVELQTMPQVAAMLLRTEGEGIIGAGIRVRTTPRLDPRPHLPRIAKPGAAASASGLEPVAGAKDPRHHAQARQQEGQRDAQAPAHADVGAAEEAPAKAADQVEHWVE
jgi:hypothetical protein